MKTFKRALSFLLVFCMVIGLLPMGIFATTTTAEESTTYTSSDDDFYRIVHLDCGRKYFTADWIKALIKEIAADGYTHLELAVGNDGLRFLLDDMSVTANGTTYTSDAVKAGIQAGNKAYYDFGTNELTQSEMDSILACANANGIEIIPLINTPGHMDAIVTCLQNLGVSTPNYNGSKTTIDLSKSTAVAFTQALVAKYAAYFAGKGCTVFNMGCDEYANDVYSSGSMGFGNLVSTGKYGSFVTYVNNLAAIVKNAGMTPMAFNDGFYFNGNTSSGTFDTDIMISFWTSGWSGYQSESASALAARGHKMINTNGDYYYVLGKTDQWDSNGYTYASNFSNTAFMGSTVSNPAGSMYCIWCDYPNAETETEIAANNRMVLRAMAARMQGQSIDNINGSEVVVSGGFMPDGTIDTSDPVDFTFTDEESGIEITAKSNLASVTVTTTVTIDKVAGTASVTWSIVLLDSEGNTYPDGASIKVLLSKYSDSLGLCKPGSFTGNVGGDAFSVTQENGYLVFTVPHFSDVTVTGELYAEGEVVPDETITIEAGKTTTVTQNNVNNEGNVDKTNLNEGIATVVVNGEDAVEATTTYTQASVTCNTLISSNQSNWTAVSGYYYKADDGNYYPVYAKRSSVKSGRTTTYTYTWGYSTTSSTSNVTQIGTQSITNTSTTPNITVYTKAVTDGTPASTTITITGVYPGTTYVTVGDTTYAVVVNYKTENVAVIVGSTTTSTQSAVISGDPEYSEEGIVTADVSGNTVTFTGVAVGSAVVTVGNTKYTVNVTEEDLTTVTPLTVEFWITNGHVTANGATSMTIAANDSSVYSESGALFSSLVPSTGTRVDDTSGAKMVFWKGTRLASDNKQTTDNGVDKTKAGTDFNYIRYWEGSWAYSSDGKTWTSVASGDQIVAYYLQETDVTNEVTTQVVDWGPQKSSWSAELAYLGQKYVLVDYTVKYESGEETPSSFPTDNSLAFHCDTQTTYNGYYYRTLGMVRAVETEDYEVYMITVTPTSDNASTLLASTAAGNNSYSYSGTEVVAWAATQTDLDNSGLGTYTSISGAFTYSIGGEPIVSGLEIYRQQGLKVTYYVRAKVTEDSLTVHYVDQTTGDEFYNYNIAVKSGTVFNANIGLADPWKGNLANGSVENSLNVTQNVSADLSTMPAIGAQYRYSDYTCVEVVRSDDGKEVYLYYTFNNTHSFVIDFGLSMKIDSTGLNIEGDWTSATLTGATYGTVVNNTDEKYYTYTPDTVLPGIETLQLTLTGNSGSVTHTIYIIPATTVYYEEGFATLSGFTGGSKGTGNQATQIAGSSTDEYGYDEKYAGESNGPSNDTQATSNTKGDTATFDFKGTGVDIYANSTTESGWLLIQVKNTSTGSTVKLLQVNTALQNGDTTATSVQNVTGYNIPVASITGLSRDYYTVTITHIDDATVNLDGFRVYDTLNPEGSRHEEGGTYYLDQEDKPTFIEIRDQVLAGLSVTSTGSNQTNAVLPTDTTVAVVASSDKYTAANVNDLLTNGPKNEIYLQPGMALVLKITTAREVQIGLKALNAETTYTINDESMSISTSTDMFYTVLSKAESESEQIITITNTGSTGSGILAITKLKVCDDPEATLGTLTEEDLNDALIALGIIEAPEETEDPTDPEIPDIGEPFLSVYKMFVQQILLRLQKLLGRR